MSFVCSATLGEEVLEVVLVIMGVFQCSHVLELKQLFFDVL